MTKIVFLAIGSVAGGLARYSLGGLAHKTWGHDFPYGTMAVNLIGCFAIGLLSAISEEKFFLGENGKLLLMIGFCGAFTTFSSFMLETAHLMKDGHNLHAFLNVAFSVVAGFFLFKLGTLAAGFLRFS